LGTGHVKGHGVFFFHVIEGIKGDARDVDGDVTWDSLRAYVKKRVPQTVIKLYGKEGGEQRPNDIGNLIGQSPELAVARITIPPAKPAKRMEEKLQGAPDLLVAPFDEKEARAARKVWAQYQQIDEERSNSIGMKLTLIPPGEFQMGSTAADLDKVLRLNTSSKREFYNKEQPQHRVRMTRPFYLGMYEVTKGQFRKFVDDTGYKTDAEKGKGGFGYTGKKVAFPLAMRPHFTWRDWGVDQSDESPVVNVSYTDAVAFCEWLSKKEGKPYRLPTEAEWEYACRAGTTSLYYNGDDPEDLTKIGNVGDAATKEKFPKLKAVSSSDGWAFTAPVGQFRPNNFGVYDMIGNAFEWCADWYDKAYYGISPVADPTGPASGSYRVRRGGSWRGTAMSYRSAYRLMGTPDTRLDSLGFRVALSPSAK
jgi:formylglycine-generating enzyme required for sulfatase activity